MCHAINGKLWRLTHTAAAAATTWSTDHSRIGRRYASAANASVYATTSVAEMSRDAESSGSGSRKSRQWISGDPTGRGDAGADPVAQEKLAVQRARVFGNGNETADPVRRAVGARRVDDEDEGAR